MSFDRTVLLLRCPDRPRVVAILVALLALAAACSGAYAALLAELFPARIRYTALSFPQNFGNGWFGGLLPAITFAIVAATGDLFAGLWYPVGLAVTCLSPEGATENSPGRKPLARKGGARGAPRCCPAG